MANGTFDAMYIDEATPWPDEEDKQLNVVIPFYTWLEFNLTLPKRKTKKKYAATEAIDMWNLIGRDPVVLEIYKQACEAREKSSPGVTECQR